MYRENTKEIAIGNVKIGGTHPVTIQSMTNTKTENVKETVDQILRLEAAGCEIIRCAVPTMEAAEALKEIKKQIHIPLVADIHFDYRLAIAAIENGADKIRINPGNIGSRERVQAVVDAAKERNIPIRVGVNSGSLEKELVEKWFLEAVESKLNKEENKVKNFQEILEKYAGKYKNIKEQLKRRDAIQKFKEAAEEIQINAEDFLVKEGEKAEQEKVIAAFIARLNVLYEEAEIERERQEEGRKKLQEELEFLKYEQLSCEFHEKNREKRNLLRL